MNQERVPIVRKEDVTIYGIVGDKNKLGPFEVESGYSSHTHTTFDEAERAFNRILGLKQNKKSPIC